MLLSRMLSNCLPALSQKIKQQQKNKKSSLMIWFPLHRIALAEYAATAKEEHSSPLLCIVVAAVVFVVIVMACRCRSATEVRTSMVGNEP
jgi:hypothetical protein